MELQAPCPQSSLDDWEAYLNALDITRIELGLARVEQVKQRLFVNLSMPILAIVAGTNGKGSTVALAESALLRAGYKVAAYTSPHLLKLNERIRVAAVDIDDAAFARALDAVAVAQEDVPLTYFEWVTLAAVYHFCIAGVDVALLEVGLGGRLDAVNVFEPAVAVVTNIGLDHQAWLGDTREAIGREKAGVFRAQKAALYADERPVNSVLAVANEKQALLRCFDAADEVVEANPDLAVPRSIRWAAQRLLESLPKTVAVTAEDIAEGFLTAQIKGRFQVLQQQPLVLVDVAHNAESTALLAQKLALYPQICEWHAVFAAYQDKALLDVIAPLRDKVAHWHCAQLHSSRACPVTDLAQLVRQQGGHSSTYSSPSEALQAACARVSREDGAVLVFGSFETVAAVLANN